MRPAVSLAALLRVKLAASLLGSALCALVFASCAHAVGQGPEVVPHLKARQIDLVDERGVVRVTLGAPTPDPVVGGKRYPRAFPVSGLVLFDANGDERGGMGVADVAGSAVVLALDHTNGDAIGWRVMPDGSISFVLNARAPVTTDAAGKTKLALGQSRASLSVGADGAPSISLNDQEERPRIRLALTKEGQGALEFLDQNGKVVHRLVPEVEAKEPKR